MFEIEFKVNPESDFFFSSAESILACPDENDLYGELILVDDKRGYLIDSAYLIIPFYLELSFFLDGEYLEWESYCNDSLERPKLIFVYRNGTYNISICQKNIVLKNICRSDMLAARDHIKVILDSVLSTKLSEEEIKSLVSRNYYYDKKIILKRTKL